METILIHFRCDPERDPWDLAHWLILDGHRLPVDEGGPDPLDQIAPHTTQRRVIFALPADDVLLATVELRIRSRQQVARAIPFALEEELSEDIETLHFALADDSNGDRYTVGVIAKARLDAYLGAAREAGITPDFVTSDVLCLPYENGEWTILAEPLRLLIRTGLRSGFSCEPENLATYLSLMPDAEDETAAHVRVYQCAGIPVTLPDSGAREITSHDNPCPPGLFALGLDERHAINLLQGPYQSENPVWSALRPWRAAAALILAWAMLSLTVALWTQEKLQNREQALRQEIEAVYRDTFPTAKRIVNPRVQMEQALKELESRQSAGDRSDFLAMLATSTPALIGAKGVRIEDIAYRDGRLEISLSAGDFQAVEGVKQQLSGTGLNATIESADTSGTKTNARLLIRGNRS